MSTYTVFSAKTDFNKRGKPAVVSIQAGKIARLSFSVEAVKLLGLAPGDAINFYTDKREPDTIYFYLDKDGFKLNIAGTCQSGYRLAIYCRPLCRKLFTHFNYSKNIMRSYDITAATTQLPNGVSAWVIVKNKLHQPVKWRKK